MNDVVETNDLIGYLEERGVVDEDSEVLIWPGEAVDDSNFQEFVDSRQGGEAFLAQAGSQRPYPDTGFLDELKYGLGVLQRPAEATKVDELAGEVVEPLDFKDLEFLEGIDLEFARPAAYMHRKFPGSVITDGKGVPRSRTGMRFPDWDDVQRRMYQSALREGYKDSARRLDGDGALLIGFDDFGTEYHVVRSFEDKEDYDRFVEFYWQPAFNQRTRIEDTENDTTYLLLEEPRERYSNE